MKGHTPVVDISSDRFIILPYTGFASFASGDETGGDVTKADNGLAEEVVRNLPCGFRDRICLAGTSD